MKSEISFEDFTKVDIRVGMITESELIPKSKKLVKLKVYFGPEVGHRVIMAGIAESFAVEMLAGIQVVAVINLAPRILMGVESHGMLLAVRNESGSLQLVQCLGADIGGMIG